jgi:hypothetical protein
MAPRILNIGNRWRWAVGRALASLWTCGEKSLSLSLLQLRCPVFQSVEDSSSSNWKSGQRSWYLSHYGSIVTEIPAAACRRFNSASVEWSYALWVDQTWASNSSAWLSAHTVSLHTTTVIYTCNPRPYKPCPSKHSIGKSQAGHSELVPGPQSNS